MSYINIIKSSIISTILSVSFTAIGLILSLDALAQDAPQAPVEIASNHAHKNTKIIRKVEPVPYWINSEQLRVRNTPRSGEVIDMLELGQKVKAYEHFENWIRITKSSVNAKWVNTLHVTNTPIIWARYRSHSLKHSQRLAAGNHGSTLNRINVEGDKSANIYAAALKQNGNGRRVIVTRKNFKAGPYFEKRLISCQGSSATHVQMLGEGYTYVMMENDINKITPSFSLSQAEKISPATLAIANYSCEANI